MKLTEQQKKDLKSEKNSGTSEELFNYLRRNFRYYDIDFDWMTKPIRNVLIDDKSYSLYENKKFLTSKIFNYVEQDWNHLGVPIIRRTIKKYLDAISI